MSVLTLPRLFCGHSTSTYPSAKENKSRGLGPWSPHGDRQDFKDLYLLTFAVKQITPNLRGLKQEPRMSPRESSS